MKGAYLIQSFGTSELGASLRPKARTSKPTW